MAKGCGTRGPMKPAGKTVNSAAKTYKSTPSKGTGGERTKGGKAAYNAPIKPSKGI